MKKIINTNTLIFAALVGISGMSNSEASLLDLTHDPLFLDQSVPPAIAVTLDDSGSMYWSYMGPSGSNGTDFTDPLMNTLYFNPNITYTPPLKADGTQMPDSNPKSAWVDGYGAQGLNNMGVNDTVDLTTSYIPIRRYIYNRWDSNVRISFVDTKYKNINNVNTTYQNYHPNWSGHAAYYSKKVNGSYKRVTVTGSDLDNFANWYSYYNSRAKLARAAISRAFSGFGPNFKIAWQELNRYKYFSDLDRFEFSHRDKFFNWLFTVPTDSGTPLRSAFKRAADLFEDDDSYWSDDFNSNLSCQQNFHIAISDGGWNSDSGYDNGTDGFLQDETALKKLPGDTAGLYSGYKGTGEQVIYSKSEEGSTLSDIAFDSWARDLNSNLNNNVKRFKKDYKDSDGNVIDFTGVTDEWENDAFVWNPKNDPAYWQHLVTYNVGMGLEASRIVDYANGDYTPCPKLTAISDPKEAVYKSLRDGSCGWPDADNENTTKIDDVWHSSINSRGEFFSANDPTELIKALNQVVNSILEKLSRGASSTVSSGIVTDDTNAYTPGFDSSTWSGSLIARGVNSDRTFGDPIWDLACYLTGGICPATGETITEQARNIYTYDINSKTLHAFDTSLSGNLRSLMKDNAEEMLLRLNVTVDDIIEYVRGKRDLEQSNSGVFKDRVSVLADIIHSSPVVVRGPGENYEDLKWPTNSQEYLDFKDNKKGYLQYKIDNQDRKNMIYVGSNGGMLHAISAEGDDEGQEKWAYIPYKALEKIHNLPDPSVAHRSYVDNTVVVRDVFINNQWRTVLIGGLRYGGQAFYALDITNPNASQPTVLWEFTDQSHPDLGFSYGKASISRLSSTGEWVALLPNGYNNSQVDYPEDPNDSRNSISTNGMAKLFVVRISDGQLIKVINTGVGDVQTPNGLASATAVDSIYYDFDGDGKNGIDFGTDWAYAGDLYGNMWRFDLSSANPGDWHADRLMKSDGVMNRPITVQPRVISVPSANSNVNDDAIVMFATGKYLEPGDRSISLPADQYAVGLVDGLNNPDVKFDLNTGDIVEQHFTTDDDDYYREVTAYPVDLNAKKGWKIKLKQQGERVFNPLALFGSDFLLVTSNVTAGIDPCEGGGKSWLVALNPYTGGDPEGEDIFKDVTVLINNQPVKIIGSGTGIAVSDFIIGRPPILENQGGGGASFIIEGSDNTNIVDIQKFTWRRRNWTNLLTE